MGISLKPQHLNRYRQIAWIPLHGFATRFLDFTGGDGGCIFINTGLQAGDLHRWMDRSRF